MIPDREAPPKSKKAEPSCESLEANRQREAEIAALRRWFAQAGEHCLKRERDNLDPGNKMTEADILVGRGEDEAALKLYLWCFDTSFVLEPSYAGVRLSYLVHRILVLGGKIGYRPALTALLERRDACEARLRSGNGSRSDAFDYETINARFRQQRRTVAMFEMLQPGTPAWEALGISLRGYFLENRRYADILKQFDPDRTFEGSLSSIRNNECSGLKPHLQDLLLRNCGPLVEALAGTGQHEQARALAQRIMGAIRRRDVREQLIEYARHAGDIRLAEDLATLPGKRQ